MVRTGDGGDGRSRLHRPQSQGRSECIHRHRGFRSGTHARHNWGIVLRDLIVGRDNPWVTLYDPGRKTLSATDTMARQNPKIAGEYAHWLTPGEVSKVEKIKPGMGAV